MFMSLLVLLPFAASSQLAAISYGRIQPVQTLVPWLAPDPARPANETQQVRHVTIDVKTPSQKMAEIEELVRMKDEEVDEEESRWLDQMYPNGVVDSQEDSLDGHVQSSAEVLTGASRLVHRSNLLDAEEAASHANQMQVDCLKGPEICNQVCWFQNCVAGDVGKVQFPEYEIGFDAVTDKARSKEDAEKNRLKSGVKTSRGPPCMNWPFGQKFYDTYPFQHQMEDLFKDIDAKAPADSKQYLGCVLQAAYYKYGQSLTID
jgi:hypothetical protein